MRRHRRLLPVSYFCAIVLKDAPQDNPEHFRESSMGRLFRPVARTRIPWEGMGRPTLKDVPPP